MILDVPFEDQLSISGAHNVTRALLGLAFRIDGFSYGVTYGGLTDSYGTLIFVTVGYELTVTLTECLRDLTELQLSQNACYEALGVTNNN